MFKRLLSVRNDESFFLFGPRGSGKSTFLEERFPQSPDNRENPESAQNLWIDLLRPDTEEKFLLNPSITE